MASCVCVGGGGGGGTALLPASSVKKGAGRNDAALSGDSPTSLHVQNHYNCDHYYNSEGEYTSNTPVDIIAFTVTLYPNPNRHKFKVTVRRQLSVFT